MRLKFPVPPRPSFPHQRTATSAATTELCSMRLTVPVQPRASFPQRWTAGPGTTEPCSMRLKLPVPPRRTSFYPARERCCPAMRQYRSWQQRQASTCPIRQTAPLRTADPNARTPAHPSGARVALNSVMSRCSEQSWYRPCLCRRPEQAAAEAGTTRPIPRVRPRTPSPVPRPDKPAPRSTQDRT